MRRRTLLTACGTSLAGLAGCVSDSSPGGSEDTTTQGTPTTTDGTTTEPTTEPGDSNRTLSVSVISLQPAVVELATPDSLDVYGHGANQYLFIDVSVQSGEPPEKGAFGFRFEGEEFGPMETRGLWYHYNRMEREYTTADGTGWLAFELPAAGDASDAAVVWPGGEWEPGASLRERLGADTPPMSMEASIPETVTPNSTPVITLTVTNEGNVDERFVAAVNRTGGGVAYAPIGAIRPLVPAGETKSIDITDTMGIRDPGADARNDGEPDLTYQVRWSGENIRTDVRIVDDS